MVRKEQTLSELLRYVVPATISLVTFSIATFFDNMLVTNGIGAHVLPALSISMPYMSFLYAVSLTIGSGTNIVASILLGENKKDQASQIFTLATIMQIIFALILTVISVCNVEKIAYLLGATGTNYQYVISYLRILVMTGPFYMISYHFEECAKPHGKPKYAPIVCGGAALFSICLEAVLIFVFHASVAAAAISLGISQMLATIAFLLLFILGKSGNLKFCKPKIDLKAAVRIIRNGIPGGMNELAVAVVAVLFNRLLREHVGDIGIISYSVISSINVVISNVFFGIAFGSQTVLSNHFGAGGTENCVKTLRCAGRVVLCVSTIIFAVSVLFPKRIVDLYLYEESSETIQYAVRAVRVYGISFLLMGINILMGCYYAAVEKVVWSYVISFGRSFVLISFLLLILSAVFGAEGIWWAAFANELIVFAVGISVYCRQQKKKYLHSAQRGACAC